MEIEFENSASGSFGCISFFLFAHSSTHESGHQMFPVRLLPVPSWSCKQLVTDERSMDKYLCGIRKNTMEVSLSAELTPGWDIYRHKQPYCVWKWEGTSSSWGIGGKGNVRMARMICMQKVDWSKWRVERNTKPFVFFKSILIPLLNYEQQLDFFKSKYDSCNYCIMIIYIKGLTIL